MGSAERRELPVPSGDTSKLPVWARKYINQLVQQLTDRNKDIDSMLKAFQTPEDSRIVVQPRYAVEFGLDDDTKVTFKIEDNDRPGETRDVYVWISQGVLQVSGYESLWIIPNSSNTFKVLNAPRLGFSKVRSSG